MSDLPVTTDETGKTVGVMPVRIVVGATATDELGRAIDTMPVRIVETATATDSAGRTIASTPIAILEDTVTTDETGKPRAVVPAREVAGLVTTNSAGKPVAVVPVRVIGGTPTPTLGTLSLSGALTNGSASSGTIIGATTGSSIVSNVTGLSVNSGARTYTFDGTGAAGTTSNGLVETLTGATGSPKSNSLTVAAAEEPLTPPELTKTSTDPDQLDFDVTFDSSYAGGYLRFQMAGDEDFTIPLTGEDDIRDELIFINSDVINFGPDLTDFLADQPEGDVFAQARIETDEPNESEWSDWITATVEEASLPTELASTNGADKSQYIDTTGTPKLTATMNNHIGLPCCVRALTSAAGKVHFEVTINSVGTSSVIEIGLVDGSVALGAAVFTGIHAGGSTGNAGCSLAFNDISITIQVNGGSSGGSTPSLQTGDIIIIEPDTVGNTCTFDHKRGGTVTPLASLTLTSAIPTDWTAYGGGSTNTGSGDSFTFNFAGADVPFAVTPSSGFSPYGS